jgi:DNA-binding transcriptional MerR regulator
VTVLIGELSRRTGVPAYQLRYYEAQGLLRPERGGNGYREYHDDAVLHVTRIRRLLEAGLSTDEIGYLLPCASGATPELVPCPELLDVMRARRRTLEDRIDRLTRSREALQVFIDVTERQVSPSDPGYCDAPVPVPAAG